MKAYEAPRMSVINLTNQDVIRTSGGTQESNCTTDAGLAGIYVEIGGIKVCVAI